MQSPTLNHRPQPTPAPSPSSHFRLSTYHFLFDPPPHLISTVLNDFDNSRLSLQDIAETHKTTVDALALWLARPHIAEVCAARRSMISDRARTAAATFLPNVARVLNGILEDHEYDATHAVNTTSPRALELRQRSRETARKASALLRSITRFDLDAPIRPTPLPRGKGAGEAPAEHAPTAHEATPRTPSPAATPDPSPKSQIRNPQSEIPPPTFSDYIAQVETSPDHAGCHVHAPVATTSTTPDSGLPYPNSALSTLDSGLPAQDSGLRSARSNFPLPTSDFAPDIAPLGRPP